jgi:membrane-bound serine protease (ClpP class)
VEWVVIVAVLGVLCIFAEVFLPGGILGIIGAILIGTSFVGAYHFWHLKVYFFLFTLGFVAAGVLAYILAIRLMPKTAAGKLIFLRTTQKGYNVSVSGRQELVGKEGVAVSFLRPTGFAQIDGKRVNVVTEGEFIEKNTKVKVCGLKDNYLVVRRVTGEGEES